MTAVVEQLHNGIRLRGNDADRFQCLPAGALFPVVPDAPEGEQPVIAEIDGLRRSFGRPGLRM